MVPADIRNDILPATRQAYCAFDTRGPTFSAEISCASASSDQPEFFEQLDGTVHLLDNACLSPVGTTCEETRGVITDTGGGCWWRISWGLNAFI